MSSTYFSKRLLRHAKRGERLSRPKTFKTEEAAKAYATEKGLKAEIKAQGNKFILA